MTRPMPRFPLPLPPKPGLGEIFHNPNVLSLNASFVRDRITIDSSFHRFLDRVQKGGTLKIVARIVEQEAGYDLDLQHGVTGRNLTIVCETFVGHGGKIVCSGLEGQEGAAGAPRPGFVYNPGNRGQDGTPGTSAGTVRVLCESAVGLKISATGGPGGAGGWGGIGSSGKGMVPEFGGLGPAWGNATNYVPGEPGAEGGDGGSGGKGGNGGVVLVQCVTFVDAPQVDIWAGVGGRAGHGGSGGRNGSGYGPLFSSADYGKDGNIGPRGKDGTYTQTQLTAEGYQATVKYGLWSGTFSWADHRFACATYHFRRADSGDLPIAKREYTAAQRLDASLAHECTTRISHIDTGVNAIGSARDLDVYPDFNSYMD